MQLRLVLYVSESTAPLSRQELLALNFVSRKNNHKCGITGLMIYSAGNFVQALEGNPLHVRDTLERIHRDVRHMNIRTLLDEMTSERMFEHWAMGLIDMERLRPLDHDRLSMVLRAAAKSESERERARYGRVALQVFQDFVQQVAA